MMYKVIKYMTLNQFDKFFLSFSLIISYFVLSIGATGILYFLTRDIFEAASFLELCSYFIPYIAFIILIIEAIQFILTFTSNKNELYLMTKVSRVKIYFAQYIAFLISLFIIIGNLIAIWLIFLYLISQYNLGDIIASLKYEQDYSVYYLFNIDNLTLFVCLYFPLLILGYFLVQLVKIKSINIFTKIIFISVYLFSLVILIYYNINITSIFDSQLLFLNMSMTIIYFISGLLIFKRGIK